MQTLSYSISFFKQGGILMIPLFLCAFASVAIIIERVMHFKLFKKDAMEIIKDVQDKLKTGSLKAAMEYLKEKETSHISKVLNEGLLHRNEDSKRIKEVIVETAEIELMPEIERFLPTLAIIGRLSPLLGLLGTVTGMIAAFNAIAQQGIGNPVLLSKGISEALITTATGLTIAIFTILFHHWLAARAQGLLHEIEKNINIIITQIKKPFKPDNSSKKEDLKKK